MTQTELRVQVAKDALEMVRSGGWACTSERSGTLNLGVWKHGMRAGCAILLLKTIRDDAGLIDLRSSMYLYYDPIDDPIEDRDGFAAWVRAFPGDRDRMIAMLEKPR